MASYGHTVTHQTVNAETLSGEAFARKAAYAAFTEGYGLNTAGPNAHRLMAQVEQRFKAIARAEWKVLAGKMAGGNAAEVAQAQAMRKMAK